jgi:uncharacterized protein with GYD domain
MAVLVEPFASVYDDRSRLGVILARGRGGFEAVEKITRAQSREDAAMPTYIMLANFTDQGIRNVKDSPKRADVFKNAAKKAGATVKEVFWTLGQYDVVAIVEAPDDVSMTAVGLGIGKLGNVRTQTLRAFSAADMKNILGKMP